MKMWTGITVFAVVFGAAILFLRDAGQESPGSLPDLANPLLPGAGGENPADPFPRGADARLPDSQAGQARGADDGGDLTLQHVEYGDTDARPWVYRDEAERQAAMRAARAGVSTGSSDGAATGAEGRAAAINSVPVTGDGPLGAMATPRVSGLPGPGATRDATGRIGLSAPPPELAGPPPEQGVQGRASEGPARAGLSDESVTEPARPASNPVAPGPGG